MLYPKYIYLLLLLLVINGISTAQDQTSSVPDLPDNLVVVWVENDQFFVRTGENAPVELSTSDKPTRLYLSPDGGRLAYAHGDNGSLELSVIDFADQSIKNPVTAETLPAGESLPLLINQVAWSDDSTLYFNTAPQSAFGQYYSDDLWRINVQTGELKMLLPAGEGGAFIVSPDRQWMVITSSGNYDHENARIRLMNVDSGIVQEIFNFPAVGTGSEYAFYPQIFWENDSHAFRAAIPEKDLIYDETNGSLVALWVVNVDGATEQIGSVPASFFGLPAWSDDGQYLTYLRRAGDPANNQFDLFLADGNGTTPIKYASGEAGSLGFTIWLPGLSQFIYAQGEPGIYRLGSPDSQPVRLGEMMLSPILLQGGQIVYASAPVSPFELRYLRVTDSQSRLIAPINSDYLLYDAILTPEN